MIHPAQAPALPADSSSGTAVMCAMDVLFSLCFLAGCSWLGTEGLRDRAAPAASPAASSDPLVLGASQAQPGATNRVALPNGQTAQVGMVRAYILASFRECRELLVRSGMAERSRVACAVPGGSVEARSLLRGGGAGRP